MSLQFQRTFRAAFVAQKHCICIIILDLVLLYLHTSVLSRTYLYPVPTLYQPSTFIYTLLQKKIRFALKFKVRRNASKFHFYKKKITMKMKNKKNYKAWFSFYINVANFEAFLGNLNLRANHLCTMCTKRLMKSILLFAF